MRPSGPKWREVRNLWWAAVDSNHLPPRYQHGDKPSPGVLLGQLDKGPNPHHEHHDPAGDENQRKDGHRRRRTARWSSAGHEPRRNANKHRYHPRADVPPSRYLLAHRGPPGSTKIRFIYFVNEAPSSGTRRC